MKSWTVVVCLVVSQLAELGSGKRFDPAMVDPLMRRSSLDKNFMRFGRSSPSYEEKDEADEGRESPPGADTNKEDSFLRSMRGKDNNFMRFGRGRNDNYMRFGRGKQDSFMRFGRARNDNYMRFGRGKDNNFMRFGRAMKDNFMRFGKGKEDNYMRFGRGKEDNYMRFGRGKQDNFMRFGRGKQDNFMRFGKAINYGKQDSFMRLGRGKQDNFMRFGREPSDNLSDIFLDYQYTDDPALRATRGKQNNLMRFGKKSEDDLINDIPIEIRSVNPKQNFMRFGRGKQDNFMRFGKSDDGESSFQANEDLDDIKDSNESPNNLSLLEDGFPRNIKSKDLNLIRLGRHPNSGNNAFIRFGKSSLLPTEETVQTNELIPQRLKRSVLSYESPDEIYSTEYRQDIGDHTPGFFTSLPEEIEEEYVKPMHQEDYSSRKKRSLPRYVTTPPPLAEDSSVVDYISAKLRLRSSQPEYESSLLSAGLPNVIVGPEFSLLPDLDPPASMLKRARPGDKSFLRLG